MKIPSFDWDIKSNVEKTSFPSLFPAFSYLLTYFHLPSATWCLVCKPARYYLVYWQLAATRASSFRSTSLLPSLPPSLPSTGKTKRTHKYERSLKKQKTHVWDDVQVFSIRKWPHFDDPGKSDECLVMAITMMRPPPWYPRSQHSADRTPLPFFLRFFFPFCCSPFPAFRFWRFPCVSCVAFAFRFASVLFLVVDSVFLSRCYTAPALLRACKPAYSPCVLSSSLSYVLVLIYFIFFFSVFFRLVIGRLFHVVCLVLTGIIAISSVSVYVVCVCSSHQTGIFSRRHPAHSVSVCGFFLLERYKLWSQNHDRHTTM